MCTVAVILLQKRKKESGAFGVFPFIQETSEQAVIQKSLKGLYSSLEKKTQFKWIYGRIQSMENIWIKAGLSLSAKYNLTGRKARQVLLFLHYCHIGWALLRTKENECNPLSAEFFLPTFLQILVHPGALTDESGFRIAESAFSGGPLGELVQWSDLISTLYILGHHLHLSASIPDLKQ